MQYKINLLPLQIVAGIGMVFGIKAAGWVLLAFSVLKAVYIALEERL